MAEQEYIARISYGKDSLKMLEVIHSRGLPLDRITTTDVWATDTISANLPPMEAFKARMDERIWQLYRIEVEHLCARNKDGSKKTYEQMFYHVPQRRSSQSVQVERERRAPARIDPRIPGSVESLVSGRTQTECPCTESRVQLPDSLQTPGTTGVRSSKFRGGEIKGFPPATGLTWCQKLKIRTNGIRDTRCENLPGAGSSRSTKSEPFLGCPATRGRKRNIVEYLGIAADEPDRFGQLNAKKRAPLVEFGIEEDLCGLYCQYADCLAPTYETSCRDGCWFCHNQGIDQLRILRRDWPDHWALLMKWDLDSPVTFKADGHTVHDFDRRFRMEDEGLVPTDKTFRWRMLDEPPKFVAMAGEQLSLWR